MPRVPSAMSMPTASSCPVGSSATTGGRGRTRNTRRTVSATERSAGLADNHEIGLFDGRDARELTSGVRLCDNVDALRVQHRDHAEPRELELVADDRAPVIA